MLVAHLTVRARGIRRGLSPLSDARIVVDMTTPDNGLRTAAEL